jgi:hypothetical protein
MATDPPKAAGNALVIAALALLVLGMSLEGTPGTALIGLAIVGFVAAIVVAVRGGGDARAGADADPPER